MLLPVDNQIVPGVCFRTVADISPEAYIQDCVWDVCPAEDTQPELFQDECLCV